VTAPAEEISQDDVSIATVDELLPKVVAPVEDKVVKAPVEGDDAPIVVPLMVPPEMVTPDEEKVLAVKVELNRPVPVTSSVVPGVVEPIPTFPEAKTAA
jgi:hypothetical protein